MKNSADLRGCYPPRPSASVDNTLLDLQNPSYPTQPHSIIAKYTLNNKNRKNYKMLSRLSSYVASYHYSYFKPPHYLKGAVACCPAHCNINSRCIPRLSFLEEHVHFVRSSSLFALYL